MNKSMRGEQSDALHGVLALALRFIGNVQPRRGHAVPRDLLVKLIEERDTRHGHPRRRLAVPIRDRVRVRGPVDDVLQGWSARSGEGGRRDAYRRQGCAVGEGAGLCRPIGYGYREGLQGRVSGGGVHRI